VTDTTQGNAMTEIALAMAMGFFSVMVLTTMSMGAGSMVRKAVSTASLAPAASADSDASSVSLKDDDVFVVYDGMRFLGRDLKPVDPAAFDGKRRIILALDPNLPLAQAMKARRQFNAARLLVTTLDADWQRTLREARHGGR